MYESLLPGSKLKEGSYTWEEFLTEIDKIPPPGADLEEVAEAAAAAAREDEYPSCNTCNKEKSPTKMSYRNRYKSEEQLKKEEEARWKERHERYKIQIPDYKFEDVPDELLEMEYGHKQLKPKTKPGAKK